MTLTVASRWAGSFPTRNKPWRFKAEARQEVDSGHEGALLELSVGTNLPLAKPLVFVETRHDLGE